MLLATLLVVMLALPLGPHFRRPPLELAAALATFSWPGGERAEVREQLLQNACLLWRLHPSAPVSAGDLRKQPRAIPCRCGLEAAGPGLSPEQSSLLWLHRHTANSQSHTINQAREDNTQAFSHHFLVTNRAYLTSDLETALSEGSSSLKD